MPAKPLKLKRERTKLVTRSKFFARTAEVLVDHDLVHLDKPFTYGVPQDLLDDVKIGSRVLIPFQNKEVEGVVVSLSENETSINKPILRCIVTNAYSPEILNLAELVARRYATSITKILRYVPVDKSDPALHVEGSTKVPRRGRAVFEQLNSSSLSKIIEEIRQVDGGALIVTPTEREAGVLFNELARLLPQRLVKGFGRAKNPSTFPENPIVVGNRAVIFWQIPHLSKIVVFDENSEHYWSDRNPYWNLRDVALLRAQVSKLDLDFYSGFPSLELARLIDLGFISFQRSSRFNSIKRRSVIALPDTYHRTIREGLTNGVVLVQTANRDYSSFVICKRCRNRPQCDCGFPLKMLNKSEFHCALCVKSITDWRCSECGNQEKLLLNRGAVRIEEELGKAFPSTPIHLSTSNKELSGVPDSGIVVATPGMEPQGRPYAALVLLDGELQLGHPTLRAEERLLTRWFGLVSKIDASAPVYIELPRQHRIIQGLQARSVEKLYRVMLEERKTSKLPPWYRLIRIEGVDLFTLQDKLKDEFPFLEISKASNASGFILRTPVERSQEVIDVLGALVRYRATKGKEAISLRIDPYDM